MKVGARFYDPEICRWIQKDPILSGVNWWVYCENDPVNYVDPLGKQGGAPEFPPGQWRGYPNPPYSYPAPPPRVNPYPRRPPDQRPPCCPPWLYPLPDLGGEPACGKGAHLGVAFALALLILGGC